MVWPRNVFLISVVTVSEVPVKSASFVAKEIWLQKKNSKFVNVTWQIALCNLDIRLLSILKPLLVWILATWSQTSHSCLPPFDIDHLEIANFPNESIVYYFLGNFEKALFIRSCHEEVILTRKWHNWAGTAFIQGDSTVGSKLIGRTLPLRGKISMIFVNSSQSSKTDSQTEV